MHLYLNSSVLIAYDICIFVCILILACFVFVLCPCLMPVFTIFFSTFYYAFLIGMFKQRTNFLIIFKYHVFHWFLNIYFLCIFNKILVNV